MNDTPPRPVAPAAPARDDTADAHGHAAEATGSLPLHGPGLTGQATVARGTEPASGTDVLPDLGTIAAIQAIADTNVRRFALDT